MEEDKDADLQGCGKQPEEFIVSNNLKITSWTKKAKEKQVRDKGSRAFTTEFFEKCIYRHRFQ